MGLWAWYGQLFPISLQKPEIQIEYDVSWPLNVGSQIQSFASIVQQTNYTRGLMCSVHAGSLVEL